MAVLPITDAFTARALGIAWDNYQQTLGLPPYLGRSFFATNKMQGLELRFIKGRKGLPVALKASNFDALAPLRDGIGFQDVQNSMPFFRESYMVTEKDRQRYLSYVNSENTAYANQILQEIMVRPLDLIQGADVVPERMIWQLLAPTDGVPKIDVLIDGKDRYVIDYTGDNGVEYKADHFKKVTTKWSVPASATPLADLMDMQDKAEELGHKLTTFVMNKKTWKQLCAAEDTKKQVQGILAYQNGIMMRDSDVKAYILDNLGADALVYNSLYQDESGNAKTFIPDGVVTCISAMANVLGTVMYGTTPEELDGNKATGEIAVVNTGVAINTYTIPHPVQMHCVVSEIVLPTYENMDSVFIMDVDVAEETDPSGV